MVLWISSSSVHFASSRRHYKEGSYQFILFNRLVQFNTALQLLKDAKLNYKNKSTPKSNVPSIVVCYHVIFHIYTCKGVLKLCDTLNVFDSAIKGEFFCEQWQFRHMNTCMSETEKLQVTGLELRISRSTDSDFQRIIHRNFILESTT